MSLDPSDHNNPFKVNHPTFEVARAVITDHLQETGTTTFENIFSSCENLLIKARIADFLWQVHSPKDPKFALAAIDAYRAIPLTADSWARDASTCWRRALGLARILGRGASDRWSEMESSLLDLLNGATPENLFFGSELADILSTYGLARSRAKDVAEKLEQLAGELEDGGNYYAARRYFSDATVWFKDAGEVDKWVETTIAESETWVKEAVALLSSDKPSNLAATDSFQCALQTYRNIPRVHREPRQLDKRMEEILELHRESSRKSQDEMITAETPAIDLTDDLNKAKELVSGKSAENALLAFTSLYHFKAKELRDAAIEGLKNSPFRAIASMTMITHDGRVGARTHGFSGQTPSERDEQTIEAETVSLHYGIHVQFASRMILYALGIMASEHQLQEKDFIFFARYSPMVPPGREILFGKALYQGYNHDFATAVHLMAPQIENIVRIRLQQKGIRTGHTDGNGITTESGLSSLIEHPEFEQAFGEDLAFEIKALFCSPYGANLRNNIAHGLLNDRECYTPDAVYAWWLGLKLAFKTFWSARGRTNKDIQQRPEATTSSGEKDQVNE